jgi:ATP-dependent DNA ligase
MSIHKPFPKLFSKKATNKIQEWEIYIYEDPSSNIYLFTEYGEINGKKILRKKEITTAKAGRSYFEEAKKQGETKYNEKINKEGYRKNIDENSIETNIIIRPMLANKFNPQKVSGIIFPCIGEEKCDGNRGIVYRKNNKIIIESRNGTFINYFDHIRNEVDELIKNMPDTFYLDGELFTKDLTFNIINGLCNMKPKLNKISEKEKEIKKKSQMLKIKYYIFDCFDIKNLNIPMNERKNQLRKLFMNKNFKYLVFIEGSIINDVSEVKQKHDEFVKNNGYEGIMLRNLKAPYELKKRSKHLQ